MSPNAIKALRSLYKINGIYFEEGTDITDFGLSSDRVRTQIKCKADFYCYVRGSSLRVYGRDSITNLHDMVLNYLNSNSSIEFYRQNSQIMEATNDDA